MNRRDFGKLEVCLGKGDKIEKKRLCDTSTLSTEMYVSWENRNQDYSRSLVFSQEQELGNENTVRQDLGIRVDYVEKNGVLPKVKEVGKLNDGTTLQEIEENSEKYVEKYLS